MDEVAERPYMPLEGFKFKARQLDGWCTGKVIQLRAGYNFPSDMAFEDLKARLNKAAKARRTYMNLWPVGNGLDYWLDMGPVAHGWGGRH